MSAERQQELQHQIDLLYPGALRHHVDSKYEVIREQALRAMIDLEEARLWLNIPPVRSRSRSEVAARLIDSAVSRLVIISEALTWGPAVFTK